MKLSNLASEHKKLTTKELPHMFFALWFCPPGVFHLAKRFFICNRISIMGNSFLNCTLKVHLLIWSNHLLIWKLWSWKIIYLTHCSSSSCLQLLKGTLIKIMFNRCSLMVQWLRFHAPNAEAWVWALPVQEARSHGPQLKTSTAKSKN